MELPGNASERESADALLWASFADSEKLTHARSAYLVRKRDHEGDRETESKHSDRAVLD